VCLCILYYCIVIQLVSLHSFILRCERYVGKLSAHKKSRLKLVNNHQWSFPWYGYCPMKDQFQMHSLYEGTFPQAELLFLSCCRDMNRVVEEVVVQFVQLSFVNALDRTSIQCFQIPSQGPLLHSFSLLQCLGVIKSFEQPLKL